LAVDQQTEHEWLVRTGDGNQHSAACSPSRATSWSRSTASHTRIELPTENVVIAVAPGLVLEVR